RSACIVSAEVGHPQLFCFSAPTEGLLRRYVGEVAEQVQTLQLSCADVALTLAQRQNFEVRLAVVAQGRAQLIEQLQAFSRGEDAGAFGTVLAVEARQVAFL